MSPALPSPSSELSDLRNTARPLARTSLCFLALNVLGLKISEARCEALQHGAEPLTVAERRAVAVFHALRLGAAVPDLSAVELYLVA